MTEGDKAFYKRRMREELQQSRYESNPQSKSRHLRLAHYFSARLDGKRLAQPELGIPA